MVENDFTFLVQKFSFLSVQNGQKLSKIIIVSFWNSFGCFGLFWTKNKFVLLD